MRFSCGAEADLANDVGVALEPKRLVAKRRRGARRSEVEEHPVGTRNALFVKHHFRVELDDDADGVGKDGAVDASNRRGWPREMGALGPTWAAITGRPARSVTRFERPDPMASMAAGTRFTILLVG